MLRHRRAWMSLAVLAAVGAGALAPLGWPRPHSMEDAAAEFLAALKPEQRDAAAIPFDDPNTHLELTMIHEVMVLDHSGPPYALILYGAALKLFVFGALVVGVVAPLHGLAPWLSWLAFVGAMLVLAVIIGVVESVMARLRLTQVPSLLVGACLMSAFGAILLMR